MSFLRATRVYRTDRAATMTLAGVSSLVSRVCSEGGTLSTPQPALVWHCGQSKATVGSGVYTPGLPVPKVSSPPLLSTSLTLVGMKGEVGEGHGRWVGGGGGIRPRKETECLLGLV